MSEPDLLPPLDSIKTTPANVPVSEGAEHSLALHTALTGMASLAVKGLVLGGRNQILTEFLRKGATLLLAKMETPISPLQVAELTSELQAAPASHIENEAQISPLTESAQVASSTDFEIEKALEQIESLRQFRPLPDEAIADLLLPGTSCAQENQPLPVNFAPVEDTEPAPFVQWPEIPKAAEANEIDTFQTFVSEMFRSESKTEPECTLPSLVSPPPVDPAAADTDELPPFILESTPSSPLDFTPEEIWRLAIAEEPPGENATQYETPIIAQQSESAQKPDLAQEYHEFSPPSNPEPDAAEQSNTSTPNALTALLGDEPQKLEEEFFVTPVPPTPPPVEDSEWTEKLLTVSKGITFSPEEEAEIEVPYHGSLVLTPIETEMLPVQLIDPPDSKAISVLLPTVPSDDKVQSFPFPATIPPSTASRSLWRPIAIICLLGSLGAAVWKFFPFPSSTPTQVRSNPPPSQSLQMDTIPQPPSPPTPPEVEIAATPTPSTPVEPAVPAPVASSVTPPLSPNKIEIRPATDLPKLPSEPKPKSPPDSGKPEDPAQKAARQAVEKFLASTSKAELLERIIAPQEFASRVNSFYGDKSISPINFDNIGLESSAVVPETKFKAFLFRVRSPDRPLGFPVCTEETPQGFKIEWEIFAQCQQRSAAKYWKSHSEPKSSFYAIIKRAHYFDNDVPNLDAYECYEISTPNPDDEKMYAFTKKDGAFERKFQHRLRWHNRYFIVGQFRHLPHGNGGSHVEILDIVRFNWRSQGP